MKKCILSFLCSLFVMFVLLTGQSYAQLQGSVSEIQAGRTVDTVAMGGVSSEVSNVGDSFEVRVPNGFYNDGMMIFPPGTVIKGNITEVTSNGRTGKNGTLGVRFTTAISPNGHKLPISAIIETKDGSGIVRGGTTKGRIAKGFLRAAEGAAAGAILGTAMGGISGGKVGRGAAYGTAIGGGIGAVSNIAAKGKSAEIKSGTEVELVFLQPVRVPGNFR